MKRIIIIILVFVIVLIGCDAGYNRYSAGASDYYDAMTVIQASVPHIGGMDLRLDSIVLLETDNYGRQLFRYSLASDRSEILLITQKTENTLVYYFEDYCYLICDNEGFTESDIAWLKNQNDWEIPLETNKCIYVDFEDSVPDHVDIDNQFDVKKNILAFLHSYYPEKNGIQISIGINALENYPNCGRIILVDAYFDNSLSMYLVLYNDVENDPIIAFEKIQSVDTIRDEIIEFKEMYCK